MLIPRFWSRAESSATTPDGRLVRFHVWRGSRNSPSEAQALAQEAVGNIAGRIQSGAGFPERYAYGDRPLREEVVREIGATTPAETPDAAITRNSYGALVLNAARVFFIDVDVDRSDSPHAAPSSSPSSIASSDPLEMARDVMDSLPLPGGIKSVLGGFFGSKPPRPAAPPPPPPPPPAAKDPGSSALDRLRRWVASHPEWHVRVYRTSAGLRYLVTHDTFSPSDSSTHEAMTALGADPQYITLCQVQKTFRARLTPKPWRIGVENPPVTFPYDGAAQEAEMREWERRYDEASRSRATCQFLQEMGTGAEHPDVAPLRALHDEHTRAASDLPLA